MTRKKFKTMWDYYPEADNNLVINNKNYYGIRSSEEIKKIVHDVCITLGNNNPDLINRSESLCNETLCAESLYGSTPDTTAKTGVGIAQIDPIAIKDIITNSLKYRDIIFSKYRIDISLFTTDTLRYDEVCSIIAMRLVYKRIEEKIPNTRNKRAMYWKKYYNSYLGKGTCEHYILNSNLFLGSE